MDRVCTQCGCSSFHYNRNRMRMECDSCGHPDYDPQQDQQLMQYDMTYSQAMRHLAAGNWDQTIHLLKPLLNQYPTEKRLYLAILRASTQDFWDMEMENTANRSIASEAWDKLIRLNGVTSEMRRYSRQRFEKHRAELNVQKARLLAWIFAAAFCSILAGGLFGHAHYFLALLCLCGLGGCLRKAYQSSPITVVKQLMDEVPNYHQNPFI